MGKRKAQEKKDWGKKKRDARLPPASIDFLYRAPSIKVTVPIQNDTIEGEGTGTAPSNQIGPPLWLLIDRVRGCNLWTGLLLDSSLLFTDFSQKNDQVWAELLVRLYYWLGLTGFSFFPHFYWVVFSFKRFSVDYLVFRLLFLFCFVFLVHK